MTSKINPVISYTIEIPEADQSNKEVLEAFEENLKKITDYQVWREGYCNDGEYIQ